jgi:hypothetical protein
VLVDATADGDPGSVTVGQVRPEPATPATWSHHLTPEALAGLAETLYGPVPPIVLVSVAAASLAEGDRLSSALDAALPELVEVVAGVVAGGPMVLVNAGLVALLQARDRSDAWSSPRPRGAVVGPSEASMTDPPSWPLAR